MSDVFLEETCLQTSVVVGKRVILGWAYGHSNGREFFCFASGHQRDFVQATANVELLQVFL